MKAQNVSLIRELREILTRSNEIIALDITGVGISKSQIQIEVLEAKRRILSGEYLSQEAMEKDVENWS